MEEVKNRLIKEEERFQVFLEELEEEASSLRNMYPDVKERKILGQMSASEKEQASCTRSVSSYKTLKQ